MPRISVGERGICRHPPAARRTATETPSAPTRMWRSPSARVSATGSKNGAVATRRTSPDVGETIAIAQASTVHARYGRLSTDQPVRRMNHSAIMPTSTAIASRYRTIPPRRPLQAARYRSRTVASGAGGSIEATS